MVLLKMDSIKKSHEKVPRKNHLGGKRSELRQSASGKRPIRGSLTRRVIAGTMNALTQRTGLQEKNKELVSALEGEKDVTRNLRNFNDDLQCENFHLMEKVHILEKKLEERKHMGVNHVVWNSFKLIKEAVKKVTLATDMLVSGLNSTNKKACSTKMSKTVASEKLDDDLPHLPACMSVPFDIYEDNTQSHDSEHDIDNNGSDFKGSTSLEGMTCIKIESDDDLESEQTLSTTNLQKTPKHDIKGTLSSLSKEEHLQRRQRKRALTYKEPSRKTKLRRGDPYTDHSFYQSPRPKPKQFREERIKQKDSLRDISNAILEPSEEIDE